MKVAVTGAAGYIGGWLLAELCRRGHTVFAQDLTRPTMPGKYWTDFSAFNLDTPARTAWLRECQPEVVIHLAALYGRVWGEVDMTKTAGINAGLTGMLARDCAHLGARLMFMSSSEIYGDSANRGTCYTDPRDGLVAPLRPMNMYGMSKKWGEEAAARYAPDGLMITRLNMPYGPSFFTPRKGARPVTSGRPGTVGYNVLHSMLWQAECGYDLVVHRGTTRCLTWVGDTCRGLVDIMESGRGGVFNVSRNDDHHDVAEIARKVVALVGSPSKIVEEDPPDAVTLRKSLDNGPLLRLGWEPAMDLDGGMKRTYDYFRRFDRDGVWRG